MAVVSTVFVLPPDQLALRLDKALAQKTGLGLRLCRDLVTQGLVTVDGRLPRKGDLVRGGQTVRVAVKADAVAACPQAFVVAQDPRFAAVHKPSGLHSALGKEASLEAMLPDLGLGGWYLANRLDCLTSGLVLAAQKIKDLAVYKRWQNQGQVIKWYVAVVHGKCADQELRNRIDDARRTVVRVLPQEDESLRWTRVFSLGALGTDTLILARIFKGRRHQIRAHLARAGHPIVGDPLYGQAETGGLFLHHWQAVLPEFEAFTLPDWDTFAPKPEQWAQARDIVRREAREAPDYR